MKNININAKNCHKIFSQIKKRFQTENESDVVLDIDTWNQIMEAKRLSRNVPFYQDENKTN